MMFNYILLGISFFNVIDSRSWDMAVTNGEDVYFFQTKNQSLQVKSIKIPKAVELSGIAYSETSQQIFLSDLSSENKIIYFQDLSSNETKINTLFKNMENSRITTLTYDSLSKSLIWIDIKKRGIFKFDVNPLNVSSVPTLFLNLSNENPQSISLDFCNRKLYWLNVDYKYNNNDNNNSIWSVNLDGSDRKLIINENLYEPVALTIDHTGGKLYWIDDDEGIFCKIERSNLDGSERQVFVHFQDQQPVHIAVDNHNVYWIDWLDRAIWYINKDIKPNDTPQIWFSFYKINRLTDLRNLLTRDNIFPVDCLLPNSSINTNFKYKKIKIDKYNSSYKTNKFCLNGGSYSKNNKVCQCQLGFNGSYCEQSLCNNYCLNGICLINRNNKPYCKCYTDYKGSRCEENISYGFSYNSNVCFIKNGKPMCKCLNSNGSQCQPDFNKICSFYLSGVNKTISRYSDLNSIQKYIYHDDFLNIFVAIFFTIIFILLTTIVVLSCIIIKLRRQRPRVKKRFLFSKTSITPWILKPQMPNSCEIMIESCCNMNMNICENQSCTEVDGKTIGKEIIDKKYS